MMFFCNTRDILIRDSNARVGSIGDSEVIEHLVETREWQWKQVDRFLLLKFFKNYKTGFANRNIHRFTWNQIQGKLKTIIDYNTYNTKFFHAIA